MALDILFAILVWQDRFDELNALGLPRNNEETTQVEVYDIRDTEFLLSPDLAEVDMPEFPLIQPIMPVEINGKSYNLMIDTGAMITIVTQSVAEHCNLAIEEKTVDVEVATEGSTAAQTARIDELTIGKSVIKNKRCMIMPDEAFDFSAVIEGVKFDGIIGWETIKRLHWEIDYQNRKVKVRAPLKEDVKRNMCCDFFPMVKIEINEGETITTGFDTGGVMSIFGKSMVGRFSGAEKAEQELMGAGQSEPSMYSGYRIPKLPINIGGAQVTLQNAFVHADIEWSKGRTLVHSGALGSDAAAGKILVIDYQNRYISIK
jgi:clan AA aspartic protease (TIGR02281 family)